MIIDDLWLSIIHSCNTHNDVNCIPYMGESWGVAEVTDPIKV